MKKAKKLLVSILLVAGVLAIPATGFADDHGLPIEDQGHANNSHKVYLQYFDHQRGAPGEEIGRY